MYDINWFHFNTVSLALIIFLLSHIHYDIFNSEPFSGFNKAQDLIYDTDTA